MDIKRAYRRLAMRWHPDKNAAAPRWVFQHMAAAYDVLGVEEERAKFDRGDYNMPDDGSDEDGGGEGSSVPSYDDIFKDWSYEDFEDDELDGTVYAADGDEDYAPDCPDEDEQPQRSQSARRSSRRRRSAGDGAARTGGAGSGSEQASDENTQAATFGEAVDAGKLLLGERHLVLAPRADRSGMPGFASAAEREGIGVLTRVDDRRAHFRRLLTQNTYDGNYTYDKERIVELHELCDFRFVSRLPSGPDSIYVVGAALRMRDHSGERDCKVTGLCDRRRYLTQDARFMTRAFLCEEREGVRRCRGRRCHRCRSHAVLKCLCLKAAR
jgi:curved DNA-binding protein CbpA